MKKLASFLLACVLAFLGSFAHAQATLPGLLANPTFTASTSVPKAGYLTSATGWTGTGTKNVGIYPGLVGLYLGQGSAVITGSLSRTGMSANPEAYVPMAVPATCAKQQVSVKWQFIGPAPWSLVQDGFKVTVGSVVKKYTWITAPVGQTGPIQSDTWQMSLAPNASYMVRVGTLMSYKSGNPSPSGVLVSNIQVTCL